MKTNCAKIFVGLLAFDSGKELHILKIHLYRFPHPPLCVLLFSIWTALYFFSHTKWDSVC